MGLKKQFKFITVCSALLSTVAPVMASPTIAVVHAADTNNSNNSENTNDTKITFVNKQGTSYDNNSTITAAQNIPDPDNPQTVLAPTSLKNIAKIINSMELTAKMTNDNAVVRVSTDMVKKQLDSAHIAVDDAGNVTIPASGFTYQVSAANGGMLNIKFVGADSNYDAFPIIRFNKINAAQGSNTFNTAPVAMVNLRDKDWKANVLKQFSAIESTTNSKAVDIKADDLTANDFDANKIGVYPASLKVKNSAGKETTLNFNIGVQGKIQDEILTKTVINKTDEQAKHVDTYEIKDKKLEDAGKANKLAVYGQIKVYNDQILYKNEAYTRIYQEGKTREQSNLWVKTDNLTDSVDQKKEQSFTKELMHAAYLYNKAGKRQGKAILKSYSYVQVLYNDKIQIGSRYFYRLANSDNYIAAGNIDPAYRKLKNDAYIYTNKGKHVTRKVKGKNKKGKTVTKTQNLFYRAVEGKDLYVKTYGAKFLINVKKGKSSEKVAMYRVGKNRYVKASDFEKEVKKDTQQTNNITSNGVTNDGSIQPTITLKGESAQN